MNKAMHADIQVVDNGYIVDYVMEAGPKKYIIHVYETFADLMTKLATMLESNGYIVDVRLANLESPVNVYSEPAGITYRCAMCGNRHVTEPISPFNIVPYVGVRSAADGSWYIVCDECKDDVE